MSGDLNTDAQVLGRIPPGLRTRTPSPGRGLLTASVIAASFAFAGATLADTGDVGVAQLTAPSIKVVSNGKEYTTLSSQYSDIVVKLRIQLDAEVSGRVKSWSAWPEIYGKQAGLYGLQWIEFKASGKTVSYPFGNRPKKVDRTETMRIEQADYADLVIDGCNRLAENLRSSGMSDAAIFSSDYDVEIGVWGGLQYEMTGLDNIIDLPVEAVLNPTFKVKCEKTKIGPVTVGLLKEVQSASLEAEVKKGFTGDCKLEFSGSITTKKANEEVEFRYAGDSGNESALHKVTTGDNKSVSFKHDYKLPKNAAPSGKIRMVGVSSYFTSNWANYEIDCAANTGSDTVTTLLPPKATILEISVIGETLVGDRHSCPSKIRYRGLLEGRGPGQGAVSLLANLTNTETRLYEFEQDEKQFIAMAHDLVWDAASLAELGYQQSVDFKMNVTNSANEIVDTASVKKTFSCKPLISTAKVTAEVSRTAKTGGAYICPVRYKLRGLLQAGASVSGQVVMNAGETVIGPVPFSVENGKLKPFGPIELNLSWKGVGLTGSSPQQAVDLEILVSGGPGGVLLKSGTEKKIFHCAKMEEVALGGGSRDGSTAGPAKMPGNAIGGAGRMTTGKPKPTHSQQAMGGVKVLQQVPGFAILSPKGSAKKGEIRLSGGKPKTAYLLTYYRKANGGYLPLRSAGLPKKMTGTSAKFKLRALKGGRHWRLEVCPSGQRTKTACKTSDFQLPLVAGPAKMKKK
ncbi:hypothetical protein [Pelagibius sp. Alg239-R121]|uniref:hypothetical protein n=1 Tax=Pelagibius sp. Alg239-R121 TaxID=2993448 RepID=UPI0024A74C75|nr:hypothetical protein [Pelagibius sp. Alg239-R121]